MQENSFKLRNAQIAFLFFYLKLFQASSFYKEKSTWVKTEGLKCYNIKHLSKGNRLPYRNVSLGCLIALKPGNRGDNTRKIGDTV